MGSTFAKVINERVRASIAFAKVQVGAVLAARSATRAKARGRYGRTAARSSGLMIR